MPHDRYGRRREIWEEEQKPFYRKIVARAWFLLIPLLGIWWFHIRELTPEVKAIEAEIAEEQQTVEAERAASLKDARKLGIDISRLKAFGDTLEVRREQITALLDSIHVVRKAHIEETRILEAQTDSLRQILSQAEGRSIEYSAALQRMQAEVDSLRVKIAAHREETAQLEEQIARTRDLTDRVLRPEAYRKNNALVAGEGDFPNRDALPKR
jgi:chromosome segregation ATPase